MRIRIISSLPRPNVIHNILHAKQLYILSSKLTPTNGDDDVSEISLLGSTADFLVKPLPCDEDNILTLVRNLFTPGFPS